MLYEEAEKEYNALRYAIEQIAIAWPDRSKYWYNTEAERHQGLEEMFAHINVLTALKNKASEKMRRYKVGW